MQTASDHAPDNSQALPLAGIRVLELGQVISAPYGGLLLAELGAEVIKIESPGGGDGSRNAEITGLGDISATFVTFNHNKRSLVLDLKQDDDYRTFTELAAVADVILSNMTPRVLASLRVDYAALAAINPRLVVCSIQGFASDDPRADEPSYDLTHQALSGLMLMEGRPGDPPMRICLPIADLCSAQYAVNGILAALVSRDRRGRGEHIVVPMYHVMLSLLTYTATMYLTAGREPERSATEHEHSIPWQAVEALDGNLVIAVRSEKFWRRLCAAIERDAWAEDTRFATNGARLEHRAELRELLDAVFSEHEVGHWLARLAEFGVPSAKVRTVKEALDEARDRHSALMQSFLQDGWGEVTVVGSPIEFAASPRLTASAAPQLDEYSSAQFEVKQDKADA